MTWRRENRTKARRTNALLIALVAIIGLSVTGVVVVADHSKDREDLDAHCPDHEGHPNKVENPDSGSVHNVTVDNMTVWLHFSDDLKSVEFFADENGTIPIAVEFCIKAADKAGGKETGIEGHVSWENKGDQIPEISYVIVYRIIDGENGPEPCIGPQSIRGSAEDSPPMNSLDWDSFPNATGYNLYRATEGGPFVLLTETDANTTSHEDFDVEVGTTYQYRVTAQLGEEESDHCDEVEITAIPVFTTALAGVLAGVLAVGAYVVSRRKA